MKTTTNIIAAVLKVIPVILLIALALYIMQPYIKSLLWAAIFAFACMPLFKRFQQTYKNKSLASALFTLLVAVLVLLPLFLIFFTISREIIAALEWFRTHDIKQYALPQFMQGLPYIGPKLAATWQDYLQQPKNILTHLKQMETSTWLSAVGNSFGFIFAQAETLFFMLVSLFFMFRDIIPFLEKVKIRLQKTEDGYKRFLEAVYGQFLGIVQSFLYIGIGTGVFMTVFFIILKMPIPFFLGAIAAICSIIPFSSPIYYLLLMFFLLIQGKFIAAIILIGVGIGVTQVIDNWLQPYIMSKNSDIHFLNILFGILGGIKAFGLIGIVLGPLILSAICDVLIVFTLRRTANNHDV